MCGRLSGVSDLADAVLSLIRTRADLWRWSAANAHGRQMHEAVDLLEAAPDAAPAERLAVCQRAIVSAVTVILKADDSSGVIGDAVRRLLSLHPAPEGTRARVEPCAPAQPQRQRRLGLRPEGVRQARPDRDVAGAHPTRRGTARRRRRAELPERREAPADDARSRRRYAARPRRRCLHRATARDAPPQAAVAAGVRPRAFTLTSTDSGHRTRRNSAVFG